MELSTILIEAHSGIRWLVVLITIIALIWMTLGLVQKRTFDQTAKRVMLAFSGLVTVQWLLGLILLLVMGAFTGYQLEHAVTMTLATGAAHMHNRFKNAPDQTRYRNNLLLILIVLMLVFIGVARLPQGWMG